MIRVVFFLVALALVAAGFAWFADRPGDIVLTWMGYRVETSLMIVALAVIALVVAVILVWSILNALLRAPEQVSLFFRHRRAMKGYLAISRGLIAIGSGDLRLARKSADDAGRLSPGDPLTLLLNAQAAQLAGDRAGAERAFRAMTRRDDTKLLGLRGLYIEAQRNNDAPAARHAAEEAVKLAPTLGWAAQAVLDDRCAVSDWEGALAALEHTKGALEKSDYRRKRAVLLAARALALNDIDRDGSRVAVLEAVKLAPDLVPAAALAGRRLAEAGEQRKARRILERAWEISPHPDIAEAYANLRLGDSARERLARMQKLAAKVPGQLEGALAVARAALEAREFGTARDVLAPYLSAPTRRVATLMAEIEETEHRDVGRVREWMGRAMRAAGDPAWTADGVVSERWLPVSPNGRLDGFTWRVPLAELGVSRPVVEVMPAPLEPPAAAPTPEIDAGAQPEPAEAADPVEPPKPVPSLAPSPAAKAKPVEPVIPLVQVPDDPGPDAVLDGEAPSGATPVSGASWQRFRKRFL
jgi:HemY protein